MYKPIYIYIYIDICIIITVQTTDLPISLVQIWGFMWVNHSKLTPNRHLYRWYKPFPNGRLFIVLPTLMEFVATVSFNRLVGFHFLVFIMIIGNWTKKHGGIIWGIGCRYCNLHPYFEQEPVSLMRGMITSRSDHGSIIIYDDLWWSMINGCCLWLSKGKFCWTLHVLCQSISWWFPVERFLLEKDDLL